MAGKTEFSIQEVLNRSFSNTNNSLATNSGLTVTAISGNNGRFTDSEQGVWNRVFSEDTNSIRIG